MTKVYTLDDFLRSAIGLDPFAFANETSNYPPHNIEKIGDERFRLTLAVAGFTRNDLEVSLHQGVLTILGSRESETIEGQLLHRGIALRDFKRRFKLDANMIVEKVALEYGLLVVDLVREVPEEQKPKLIPIG